MKKWLRRSGCLLLILIWLGIASLPLLAVVIARNGQVRLGAQESAHLRIFLVQEEKKNGLGIEWARSQSRENSCWLTYVTYWLWEGQGENVTYCQCYDAAGSFSHNCPP